MTNPLTHVEELRHVAAMDSCSWDYAQKLMRSSADEIEHLSAYQQQMNDILKENERLRARLTKAEGLLKEVSAADLDFEAVAAEWLRADIDLFVEGKADEPSEVPDCLRCGVAHYPPCPERPLGHTGGSDCPCSECVAWRTSKSDVRAPEVCGCPYGQCHCDDGSERTKRMTPEQFLDERFPHLKGPYRSMALKAIKGEQMPLSRIDGRPEAQAIKDAWNEYQRASLRRSE